MSKKRYQEEHISITIDEEKCTGCGECVMACPVDIFSIVDGKSIVSNLVECVQCIACVNVCPVEAIEHSSC